MMKKMSHETSHSKSSGSEHKDSVINNYNHNQEIDSRQSLVSKKTLMEKHEVI